MMTATRLYMFDICCCSFSSGFSQEELLLVFVSHDYGIQLLRSSTERSHSQQIARTALRKSLMANLDKDSSTFLALMKVTYNLLISSVSTSTHCLRLNIWDNFVSTMLDSLSLLAVGQAKMVHKMVPKKAIFTAILWRVLLDPVLV
jgi:hypothetical protein